MLELVAPDPDRREAWLAAHREWGPGLHEDGFGIGEDDYVESDEGFALWVTTVLGEPGSWWWIVDGDTILGGIGLRSAKDPRVKDLGHIGYGIRPSARGRGIATWAPGQVLGEARYLGINPALLVCRDDNPASIRTIEHYGGVLQRVIAHNRVMVRYHCVLSSSTRAGPGLGLATPARASQRLAICTTLPNAVGAGEALGGPSSLAGCNSWAKVVERV